MDTRFQSFSPLINRIVHHDLLKFSPCLNKSVPQLLVRIMDDRLVLGIHASLLHHAVFARGLQVVSDVCFSHKIVCIYTVQACQKTCYQRHVIERCGCFDAYYPAHNASAFNHSTVPVCSVTNITQGTRRLVRRDEWSHFGHKLQATFAAKGRGHGRPK